MDRERKIKDLFDRVWDCAPEEWARLLVKLCPDDEALRDEVMSLLRAQSEAGDFLETPPFIAGLVEREMPLPDFSGRRIGNYELQRVIGRGGMATVYLAARIDDEFRQQVAVKLIWSSADTEDVIRRFKQERQILADLNHPNIARLLDGGTTEEGWPFLVMEYIEGRPITTYCSERRLSIDERLRLFQTVCAAVAHAHRNLIIHRDLKPGNILVTAEGVVKLLDFGVAKVLTPESESRALTRAGLHWLTPDYASPEQMREEKVTTASDVYSLGVLLYELLAGARPLDLRDQPLHEAIRIVCEEEPLSPSARRRQSESSPQAFSETGIERMRRRLRGDLDNIVLKALHKNAGLRYQTVEQLSEDIGRHLNGEMVLARKRSFAYWARSFWRRHKWQVTLAALLALALIAVAIFAWIRAVAAEAEARRDRRLLYAAQMRQSGYDLEEGNFTRLHATLESFAPQGDEEDLRGFEWRYLWRQLHRGRMDLPHAGWVYAVAYSPDGKKIASACEDGSAKIWEAATGRELLTLEGHSAFVWSLAFSPDGGRIATGGEDGVMKLWDAATGRELMSWKSPYGQVHSIAFSPDGKKLLMGTDDELVLMDVATEKILLMRNHEGGVVFATAFLPDGRRFVSVGEGGWLRLWDAVTGRLLSSINAHPDFHIFSVAVSADGRRLASSGGDRVAKLWDLATGKEIAAFAGHDNAVRGVAFSPDDQSLVTASSDRTVKLWNIATKQESRVFRGHVGRIRDVAFSPDGRHIASCGDDRTVKIWNLKTENEPPETISGHAKRIFSAAFSPDGHRLATASSENTAKIWDVMTGREVATMAGHTGELYSVTFSRDGQTLATGAGDGTVRLWNAATGQPLEIFRRRMSLIAFTPDGKPIVGREQERTLSLVNPETRDELATLKDQSARTVRWRISANGSRAVSGDTDGLVGIWDMRTGRKLVALKPHSAPLYLLRISPDGGTAFSGATDGEVKVWDAGSGRMLAVYKVKKLKEAAPPSFVLLPNDRRLIICRKDNTVDILDAMTGRELMRLKGHSDVVQAADFSPDGRLLATGGKDQTVRLWDAVTGKELALLRGHTGWIFGLAFSPDGQMLASASGDLTVKLWDVKMMREIRTLNDNPPRALFVLFSPDGKRLLTSDDGTAILWDVATGQQVAVDNPIPARGSALSVAFSPKGGLLAASYGSGIVALWDVQAVRQIAGFKGHSNAVWSVNFSPDGQKLITASWDGAAKVWDAASGREIKLLKGHNGPITTAAFSPDGKFLATGGDDHTVKLWDAATYRELFTLAGHADQVLALAFSPDSRRLATSGTDQTVRIWDVEIGQELLALRGHKDEVWSVAFSPDGKTLASGSWDMTVRLWRTATEAEMQSKAKK